MHLLSSLGKLEGSLKLKYQLIPFLFSDILSNRSSNAQYVLGPGIITGWLGNQFAGVEPFEQSAVWRASTNLKISGILYLHLKDKQELL